MFSCECVSFKLQPAALTAPVFVHNLLSMTHLCQEVCLVIERYSETQKPHSIYINGDIKRLQQCSSALRGESTEPRYDESESKINLPP